MGKSLDFCKKIALDKTRSTYYDRPWNEATEVDSTKIIEQYIGQNRKFELTCKTEDGQNITIIVSIERNPDADFSYFASESATHDGTLLFIQLLFERVINKICSVGTYDTTIGAPRKNVKYTIGDFVLLNEYGDFGTKEKPWLYVRSTVLLPIKYETY